MNLKEARLILEFVPETKNSLDLINKAKRVIDIFDKAEMIGIEDLFVSENDEYFGTYLIPSHEGFIVKNYETAFINEIPIFSFPIDPSPNQIPKYWRLTKWILNPKENQRVEEFIGGFDLLLDNKYGFRKEVYDSWDVLREKLNKKFGEIDLLSLCPEPIMRIDPASLDH